MNAEQHAHMVETGEAPCGCHVVIEGDTSTVFHECDPDRQAISQAANEQYAIDHAERQERKMLLSMIPLSALRKLAGVAEPTVHRKAEEPVSA